MTYTKIGEVSEECKDHLMRAIPKKLALTSGGVGDPNYESSFQLSISTLMHEELVPLIPNWENAQSIVVRLPPHDGKLHTHTHDRDNDKNKTRYHVVLETNDQATCRNGEDPQHLDYLGVYRMEPYLPHDAENRGDTPRTHLVIVTEDL